MSASRPGRRRSAMACGSPSPARVRLGTGFPRATVPSCTFVGGVRGRWQSAPVRTTPFAGSEAILAGTWTKRELRRSCTRVYRDVYQRRGSALTARDRAVAAWLWSEKKAVVAGNSAAALLGAEWVDPHRPAELVSDRKRPPRLIVTRN